jgi:FlaG/FlaF family flagellin (archaellin)
LRVSRKDRRAVSEVVAALLLISMSVVGAGVFYAVLVSYSHPLPQMSPQISMSVGASGFAILDIQVVNTGGIPYSSIIVTIAGQSSSQLQITFSAQVAADGGIAQISVRGISGGPYSPMSSATTASGNLVAASGSNYVVTIEATLSNGGTYRDAFSITAGP